MGAPIAHAADTGTRSVKEIADSLIRTGDAKTIRALIRFVNGQEVPITQVDELARKEGGKFVHFSRIQGLFLRENVSLTDLGRRVAHELSSSDEAAELLRRDDSARSARRQEDLVYGEE